MKTIAIIIGLFFMLTSCSTTLPDSKPGNSISLEKGNEEDEYDLIVFDTQYDLFLRTQAKPMHFYSESYYRTKNQRYVNEWNYRSSQPMQYDPNIYTLRIEYDSSTHYGLNLEYKLYNYFKFIEWKYKVNLDF